MASEKGFSDFIRQGFVLLVAIYLAIIIVKMFI